MRPPADRVARQILPIGVLCLSICHAADGPVLNELNTTVEEPPAYFPEVDSPSPFRSVSRPRSLQPSSRQDALIQLAEDAVDSASRRLLSTDINTPWQIMHGLLALRQDFQIRQNGVTVSGLDWVSSGPTFEGEAWFEKTPYGGRAHPYSRPWAFEGHANQFLALLSMSALPLDHQFGTPTGPITIGDMVEHAQKTISTRDEPTWTLWALSRYLPPDAAWQNTAGESWSIERLVSIQTRKPLQGTACGGTHGMFALAHARNVYLRTGKPLRGVWLEAEYKIRRQVTTARVQQNSNGMLSSNYFRGREYDRDFNKRMASAGHILEFLMIALPQDEVQQQWVRRAIEAVAQDLLDNRKATAKCSPLYHAVNGLNIYLDRMKLIQPTDVASNTDSEAKLRPVDEEHGTKLKRVPASSISVSTPLETTDEVPDASRAAQQSTAKSGTATDPDAPATATPNPATPNPAATADDATKDSSPVPAPVPAKLPAADVSGKQPETGWKKSSKADDRAPASSEPQEEAQDDDEHDSTKKRDADDAVDTDVSADAEDVAESDDVAAGE